MAEAGSIYPSRRYSWEEIMRMQRAYVPERCRGKPPHLLPHLYFSEALEYRLN